ncbi:MAG: NAD(P)H-hydrate epimerase [Eggerthellaceae bacterium]
MTKYDGPILNVSEVKTLEQNMIVAGTPAAVLMDRAGFAVAQAVADRFEGGVDDLSSFGITIFCGTGNNGGDGWVAAMYLTDVGFPVTVFSPVAPQEIPTEPARSAAMTLAASQTKANLVVAPSQEEVESALKTTRMVVDAMVGVGFNGQELSEPYASWAKAINAEHGTGRGLLTLAVDAPSGLNAQTGAAVADCVIADATVTMLAYKPGVIMEENLLYCGIVGLAPLTQ